MDIRIEQIIQTVEVPVTVHDRFYGVSYSGRDTISMKKYIAIVDGYKWTVEQTYQALEDSRQCRCRRCVVCDIKQAVFHAEFGRRT